MKFPSHIGLIMDGNGRWAQERNLRRHKGHIEGCETVKKIVNSAHNKEIAYLTLFAFSSENWKRPGFEVRFLMQLLERYLVDYGEELHQKNICLKTIGQIEAFPRAVQKNLKILKEKTQNNTGLILTFALNFGGRQEIFNAVKKLIKGIGLSQKFEDELNSKDFESFLESSYLPDMDLMIRTSGEQRLSNFLLWKMAYTELYFSPKYWPDFSENDFIEAIHWYQTRQRKFGGLDLKSTNPSPTKL